MNSALPKIEHIYQNHLLDSTRWHSFEPRDDDIIIATPYKSGTTWMQNIVLHLIFQDLQKRVIDQNSLWLDCRPVPLEDVLATYEAQTHRRCIKTHLPLDGLRFLPQAKYIVVGRDPRDVFMSLWNHYSCYLPDMLKAMNEAPGRVGPPMPACPGDIREFWKIWLTRGWFEWENEGYPHWSNFRHVQTWWDYRHLPNILFVHFNELLADLDDQIARIAGYLGIDCPEETRRAITDLVTFKSMKSDAEILDPTAQSQFKGGAKTFFNKGTNGRWREVLTAADLKMYNAVAARELTPDCRRWLEGRGSPQKSTAT